MCEYTSNGWRKRWVEIWYETLEDHCRGGGVCIDCIDVDGVEDNGTANDEVVDAEIEGTVRFGGLGEFFTTWDLQGRKAWK